jgi:hypothetical protein
MVTPFDFLRMLEPPVRPGQLPGPAGAKPALPIEQRSFEELLGEAQGTEAAELDGASEKPAVKAGEGAANLLQAGKSACDVAGLSGIDRIENASLRTIMER